jgi:amidophosphoribosyltransferase
MGAPFKVGKRTGMCGIIGFSGNSSIYNQQTIYDSLSTLQHRGQDAAGIVTFHENRFYQQKGLGTLDKVYQFKKEAKQFGHMGLGHVRYPTAGCSSVAEAQPFYVSSPYGIAFAHNGNLTNMTELAREVVQEDLRHLNTNSDSEVMLNIFAHALQEKKIRNPRPQDIFDAVDEIHKRCRGAYAVTALIANVGMLAFRDPHGIRPLVYASRETDGIKEYMVASESCAFGRNGFKMERDIEPAEAMLVDTNGQVHFYQSPLAQQKSTCAFEYVYLARKTSVIDGASVSKVRKNLGRYLGEKIKREWHDKQIDVVIPIPSTSETAAPITAEVLGLETGEGMEKNRYSTRTFIESSQQKRESAVRLKFSLLPEEYKDKNILLIDDSIVRGTTIKEIILMARGYGAKKVYVGSTAPQVRYPNVYGIDMPSRSELIAFGKTDEQLAKEIGADGVIFQDLEDLKKSITEVNPKLTHLDLSVFNGEYVTNDITEKYLENLQRIRNDAIKSAYVSDSQPDDMYRQHLNA